MPQQRRYSKEFKREAVRLVTDEGYSQKAAAEAVGVCPSTIREWVQRSSDANSSRMAFASEQDEIEHLRKENRRLRMERDLLKKAAAFFANEPCNATSS